MYSDLKERTNKVAQIMMCLYLVNLSTMKRTVGLNYVQQKLVRYFRKCIVVPYIVNKLLMHGEVYVLIGFNP